MRGSALVIGTAVDSDTIAALGYDVAAPVFEAADPDAVEQAVAGFGSRPLDLLVLGTEWRGAACPAASVGLQDWRRAMLVHAYAPFRLAVALRPNLEAGTGKTVLAVAGPHSSVSGVQGEAITSCAPPGSR